MQMSDLMNHTYPYDFYSGKQVQNFSVKQKLMLNPLGVIPEQNLHRIELQPNLDVQFCRYPLQIQSQLLCMGNNISS